MDSKVQMRKVLLYSLVGFYFLISIRLTANFHFCCGNFKAFSLVGFGEHKTCCKGKSKSMNKKCCKDVQLTFKKCSQDQRNYIASAPLVHIPVTPVRIIFEERAIHFTPTYIAPSVNAPPPEAFPQIFLKNCVFII